MLSDGAKRGISFAVFGAGLFGGLWACGASMQAIFTLGANDTLPGILTLILAFDTPVWACLIALWHRRFAGWWLALISLYFPFGMYSEMYSGRVRPEPMGTYVLFCMIVSVPLLAIGLFGILTERAGWPKMFRWNPPGA